MLRVRIAPSPTGFAHVGTAYSALFNYAFAKKNKGKFILRLEDTDVKRNVKGAEEAIYEGLSWLGINWDEGPDKGGAYGPYRQSERLKTYKEWADKLLVKDMAYKDEGAIRFRNPGEDVGWKDLVRGEISFPGGEITDFVILKTDGYPTYNFGVVIDDILMEITHVIRGEEHISNTPRQIALYKAFAKTPPEFAHLPTLRNSDKKKLSKRRDPVNLRIFKEQGYLPDALVNFLCLLGWSHPEEEEIFDLKEFIFLFDIKRVRKAGPIFDLDKLNWFNGHYIRQKSEQELLELLRPFVPSGARDKKLRETIPLVKERITKLSDFSRLAGFIFKKSNEIEPVTPKYAPHISLATQSLEKLDEWDLGRLNQALGTLIQENNFKTGDFYMDLRGTISGSSVTPPINESIVILGKDETIKRLKRVSS